MRLVISSIEGWSKRKVAERSVLNSSLNACYNSAIPRESTPTAISGVPVETSVPITIVIWRLTHPSWSLLDYCGGRLITVASHMTDLRANYSLAPSDSIKYMPSYAA